MGTSSDLAITKIGACEAFIKWYGRFAGKEDPMKWKLTLAQEAPKWYIWCHDKKFTGFSMYYKHAKWRLKHPKADWQTVVWNVMKK